MTPTATYIAEENCLQLLPTIKKPELWEYFDEAVYQDESTFRDDDFKKAIREYEAHLATLRKIPCSPEPGFKDGEKYTEGVDYEIKGAGDWKWSYQLKGNIFAIPLVPVKSEDELWLQAIHYLRNNPALSDNTKVADLKAMFTINKR